MTTKWQNLYGPIVAPNAAANVILTVPANVSYLLSKFTISNGTASAAVATVTITPSGGVAVVVCQRTIPAKGTTGNPFELSELEGQILNAGDTITFQDGTGSALSPMISGVAYTS